jgi:hypothetical protein
MHRRISELAFFGDEGAPVLRTTIYIVIYSGGKWWVDAEGKPCGPFASRQEAQEGAVVLATTFGDPGRVHEVYAPDDNGRQRSFWRSGGRQASRAKVAVEAVSRPDPLLISPAPP